MCYAHGVQPGAVGLHGATTNTHLPPLPCSNVPLCSAACDITTQPQHPLCVQRPRDVVVRAQDETGAPVTLELGGDSAEGMWLSRIFQHEYDHLNGVLFHDRMAPRVLAGVAPTLVALENVWMRAHPGVAVQRVQRPTAGAGRAVGRKRGF